VRVALLQSELGRSEICISLSVNLIIAQVCRR
jgi:hypothetical protein